MEYFKLPLYIGHLAVANADTMIVVFIAHLDVLSQYVVEGIKTFIDRSYG